MEEIWKPIYDGYYEVSDFGNIRRAKPGKSWNAFVGRKLNSFFNEVGYCRVRLTINGKGYMKYVHSLVLEAFIGGRPKGLQINHLDGDKANNRLGNLEHCTPRENIRHSIEVLGNSVQGENDGNAVLTETQVREIRKTYVPNRISIRFLAKKYKVSSTTVHEVIHKTTWKHIQ